jgi:hypothetical protein
LLPAIHNFINKRGKAMGRGRPILQGSPSGSNLLDTELDFKLFSTDEDGNDIAPTKKTIKGITSYTFAGAVEDFQARFDDVDDKFAFNVINITERFAESGEPINLESSLTTDLIARYIPNENTIEFAFGNPELTDIGLNKVALVIQDQDKNPANGFQVNDNFTIEKQNLTTAINNLESISSIITESLSPGDSASLGFEDPVLEISSGSKNNPQEIIPGYSILDSTRSPVIIEAEDILDDSNDPSIDTDDTIDITGYKREDYTYTDGSGLRLSPGQTTGTISFEAQDYDLLSGTYNLRVNAFDEKDGAGTIRVQVIGDNDTPDDTTDDIEKDVLINLNENTTSPFPTDDTFRSYFIEGLNLAPTDKITITGESDGQEWARIDFLTFDPI